MAEPVVCFEEFRLDLQLRSLRRGPEIVKLTPKPFTTLEFLVINRQRVVSKAELLERIWGGQREVSTVEHAISQVRRALGDDAENARYILTVPGQGYRFVAAVHPLAVKAATEAPLQELAIQEPRPAPKTSQTIAAVGVGRMTVYARLFRRRFVFAVVLACMVVIGTTVAHIVASARIARALWNGSSFVAMSDSGRALWQHAFGAPLRELSAEESVWRTQIVDLNGDGIQEVLVAASFASAELRGRDEIDCFSSKGRLLWRYKPQVGIEFNTRDLNGPWRFTDMLVVPHERSGSIWVAVVHDVWWPSFIMRLSATGVSTRVFTSSGTITVLRRVQTKTGSYVLGAGVNNEYRPAALTILSETGPPATSPQTEGSEYQCIQGCPAARPYRYILLPRSELNIASDLPYNEATQIHTRPRGITVETHEAPGGGTAFYDFSQDLQPERVAFGGNYREVHQRFEREGRIHHSFKDCPERKRPALLRICDDGGNWRTAIVPRVPSPD